MECRGSPERHRLLSGAGQRALSQGAHQDRRRWSVESCAGNRRGIGSGGRAMTDFRRYPKVRLNQPWDILARTVLNNAMAGKLNVAGEFVLTAGSATSVLNDALITRASCVTLMPLTANAASALSTLYFDATGSGSVVIRHANNGQTDRSFRYAIIG